MSTQRSWSPFRLNVSQRHLRGPNATGPGAPTTSASLLPTSTASTVALVPPLPKNADSRSPFSFPRRPLEDSASNVGSIVSSEHGEVELVGKSADESRARELGKEKQKEAKAKLLSKLSSSMEEGASLESKNVQRLVLQGKVVFVPVMTGDDGRPYKPSFENRWPGAKKKEQEVEEIVEEKEGVGASMGWDATKCEEEAEGHEGTGEDGKEEDPESYLID
ncbi:MAG: hypothetical protein MMC33_001404 [Icmadophila ericetorum]|nr:hypothetical protein [Icmadophila ericetorum]